MSERVSPSDNAANPLCGDTPSQYDKPHIPEKCRAGLAVANAGKPLAQLAGDAEPILNRIREGEKPQDIAKSLGVSHVALYCFLMRNCPDEWRALSAGRSLARMEAAEIGMDEAQDQVEVSRARESFRMASWHLERVAKAMYGETKQEGGTTVQVFIARDGADTVTIEHDKAA